MTTNLLVGLSPESRARISTTNEGRRVNLPSMMRPSLSVILSARATAAAVARRAQSTAADNNLLRKRITPF